MSWVDNSMSWVDAYKDSIPDWAKDIRLNLDSTVNRSSLDAVDAQAVALAAAFACKNKALVNAIAKDLGEVPEKSAALTAASLMAMNNIWYPYVEMAADEDLKSQRPELRMNAYATFGGVTREKFEMYALAASIVGKCHFCIGSHYKLLKDHGITITQLRDIGRIAAVISAVSQITA